MRNFRIVLQYEGTKYQGWQKQESTGNTIQGKLESILSKMAGTQVEVHGAGRTDAGVSSYGQVVHFDSTQAVPPKNLKKILNKKIYPHIYVSDIEIVDESFHSRKSAKGKEYHYIVDIGEYDPLQNNYVLYHSTHMTSSQ